MEADRTISVKTFLRCMWCNKVHSAKKEEMMRFEYIKWFWKYIDAETPVLLFYEVDLENERYTTRMTEVFCDKTAKPVIEEGFEFITEAPVPEIEEINCDPEFYAEIISREEFEEVYYAEKYSGSIEFPK